MRPTMTSRERLLAAIRHEETDMVPFAPVIRNYVLEKFGGADWLQKLRLKKYFDFDPIIILGRSRSMPPFHNYMFNVGGHYYDGRGFCEDLEPGVKIYLKVERQKDTTTIYREVETPAGRLKDVTLQPRPDAGYGIWPQGTKKEFLIKEPEDLEKVAYLLPKRPQKTLMADATEIVELVGEEALVGVTIHSPLTYQAADACGVENLMIWYYENKPFLLDIIRLFHEHCMHKAKTYLEAGMKFIHMGWWLESISTGWSPAMHRELFLPYIKEQIDLIHSYDALAWFYDDGKMMKILPELKEAKPDIVSSLTPPPVGDVDLKEAKELIGEDVCLKGNIDSVYHITRGTPQIIEEAVKEALRIGAPGSGFILSNSDPFFGVPEENIKAYFEAGRKYGRLSYG